MTFKFGLCADEILQDTGELTAVIDLDYVKYSVASVGDDRYIEVFLKESGKKVGRFPGKTEWWGVKGNGGLFKSSNEKRIAKGLEPYSVDDFEIVPYSEPKSDQPIEFILHSAKQMILSDLEKSGTKQYIGYYGSGESFRVGLSTLKQYKGQRELLAKPSQLEEVTEYLAKRFKGKKITGIEADDKCVMECWGNPNKFIIGIDKDYYGSGAKFFNPNYPDEGIIDTNCFGKLWLETKETPSGRKSEKIRGYGRMFKMFQVCSEDTVDNYKANCYSDVKWGAKSAYKALVDCQNDKELFEAAYGVFKKLYPEPKKITGWRGDEIEIDAMYVFQEMMNMAHLHRWEGDYVNVKDVMIKLGVI